MLDSTDRTDEKLASEDANWVTRAVSGFIDSGKDAAARPGLTAVQVGVGLQTGAALEYCMVNSARMGGAIGNAAKLITLGLYGGTLAMSAVRIGLADDGAYESGRAIFDSGLLLGSVGTSQHLVGRLPGIGRHFQPKALTDVPPEMDFRVVGGKATVDSSPFFPTQVRLSNGKGFEAKYVVGNNPVDYKLVDMPLETPHGKFTYSSTRTSLKTNDGQWFYRDLATDEVSKGAGPDLDRLVSIRGDGTVEVRTHGHSAFFARGEKGYEAYRVEDGYPFTSIKFRKDGTADVIEGPLHQERNWTISADRSSMHMYTLPGLRKELSIEADGKGVFSFFERGPGADGGAGARSIPLRRSASLSDDKTKVIVDDEVRTVINVPDVTRPVFPADVDMQALVRANEILRSVSAKI